MSLVTTDFVDGARTFFQALFNKVIGNAQNKWGLVATKVPSEKSILTFNWVGPAPMMRDVLGSITVAPAHSHNFNVTITEHGVGISIKERMLREDPLENVGFLIENLSFQASKYYDKLVFAIYTGGFATYNGYDGTTFFADSHTFSPDATGVDNKLSGASSDLEADDANGAYAAARKLLFIMKDDQGEPMGIVPEALICGPDNEIFARKLLTLTTLSGGGENIYASLDGKIGIVPTPYLATTTEWFLVGAGPVKPVILGEQLPIRFAALDDMKSSDFFHKKEFLYKVEAEAKAAVGEPRLCVGSVGA